MVKLSEEAASNNFFACLLLYPLIGDESLGSLEVVRELCFGLKAASNFSK